MYSVKYAIIISMNEEGNGATAPQVQNQAPMQPAKPTSSVIDGFDDSKIGSGKKHKPEKVKKVKEKKDKEAKKINQSPRNASRERTKRPLWFWIVLGVLGVVIIGAIIWMVLVLTGFYGDSAPADLVLESGVSNSEDGVNNSVVANYVSQLQQVYDNANSNDDTGSAPDSSTSAQEVSKVVEKALKTNQGSSQADSIRLAELAVAYNNSNYERAEEILGQVNPDKLSIKDQIYYYAIIETVYERSGDSTKAQEAFSISERLIEQLCKMQECKQ